MHASTIDPISLARASARFDFVTALSAEACCALCNELHAAVDQRHCARCGAASCPDCVSPDSPASSKGALGRASEMTWICRACAPRHFARVRQRAVGQLRRVASSASASTRQHSARAARALNAHAVGLLLGTAILVAIARMDDRVEAAGARSS